MSQRAWMALTLILGIALGAGAMWMARSGDEEPAIVPTPVSLAGSEVPPIDLAAEETGLERIPPPDSLPPEAEKYPQYFEDLEGKAGDEPTTLPPTVEYPRLEKFTQQPMSPVPHRLLGAWDEDHTSSSPGLRRAFVVVVEPGVSDAHLEALARDIRLQHAGSVILDVRIYDSERAAIQSRAIDGGALAFQHLVAEVKKNDRIPLDVIRVRGRRIDL
jgi:hypothetical protein